MLREFLAMGAAFGFLIFFPKGKLWNGASLLLTGLIMGLGAGQSPKVVAENFTGIVTSPPTMKTIAVILQIGVLSALMKQYDILGRLVEAFEDVFSSTKAVIMILPAAIGMVSVPGGAAISSPFVDELGDSLRLPVFKRAALNVAFVAGMEFASYLLYLRGAEAPAAPRSGGGHTLRGLVSILKYMSPIYVIVLLNGLFKVPMYLSAFASLMLILAGWGRSDAKAYARAFWQGLSGQTFVTMLGIYFMQNTVRDLTGIMGAFQNMFVRSSGFGVLLVIAAAALLFGLATGLSYVPLGVLVPLLTSLHLPPTEELLYCVFIYTWSFNGYFFSPLHLCQALTLQQMNCSVSALDKGYLPLMIEMAVAPFVIFGLYRTILL